MIRRSDLSKRPKTILTSRLKRQEIDTCSYLRALNHGDWTMNRTFLGVLVAGTLLGLLVALLSLPSSSQLSAAAQPTAEDPLRKQCREHPEALAKEVTLGRHTLGTVPCGSDPKFVAMVQQMTRQMAAAAGDLTTPPSASDYAATREAQMKHARRLASDKFCEAASRVRHISGCRYEHNAEAIRLVGAFDYRDIPQICNAVRQWGVMLPSGGVQVETTGWPGGVITTC